MSEIESYSKWLSLSKSVLTARAYLYAVTDLMRSVKKAVNDLKEAGIVGYLYDLKRRCNERSLARHAYAIRSFLQFAGKVELASKVPVPSSWQFPEPMWLTEGQVKSIVGHATSVRDRAMLQTAYDLALRVGEVRLLDREWFSHPSKTMKVLRLKRRGQREFILPVQEETADLLKRYLESRNTIFVYSEDLNEAERLLRHGFAEWILSQYSSLTAS